ncbi:MAG: ankyrin repeat domain-containing protein [Alphaproteobacteria bacterium]|nr:MAG: ankyrin repeat domain-containing protein [Alphaproteobacteria bacterium]
MTAVKICHNVIFCDKVAASIDGAAMSAATESFNASTRPDDSPEVVAARLAKAHEEFENQLRPAPGDSKEQLSKKLLTVACPVEPTPALAEIARQLIDLGADVLYKDKHDCTALLNAASAGNAALVKTLLEKGADPNAAEAQWHSDGTLGPVICHAAYKGNADIIRMLIAAGADPDASTDPGGRTALILAIDYARVKNETQRPDSVAALVESGASLDKATAKGWTPLLYCIHADMPVTAKYLIEKGADPAGAPGAISPYDLAKGKNPDLAKHISDIIALRKEQEIARERLARETQQRLDHWLDSGCPTADAVRPMPVLKLKTKTP